MNRYPAQPTARIPTLQEIEAAFQRLQFQLGLNISSRLKARVLGEFCGLLLQRDRIEINHSYYQEILPEFGKSLSQESLEYQPLRLLQALFKTLSYLFQTPGFLTTSPSLTKAMDALIFRAAATSFYVKEWLVGLQIISPGIEKSASGATFSHIHNYEQLIASSLLNSLSAGQRHLLQSIQDEWQVKIGGFSNREVWIPLVEKWASSPNETVLVGTLYPLELDLEERKTNHNQDLIFFNNHPVGLDDLVNYQAQDAIQAARTQHAVLSKFKTPRYSVVFGFPQSDYFYSGSSFGLGMALLSLCALEKETNLRRKYSIKKNVAFTGGVDLRGEIRPVNQDSLVEKISAVFFSPLEKFVLPSENLEAGLDIVADLRLAYPNKDFEVIGEGTVETTLHYNRFVTQETMPFFTWAKIHFTRSTLFQLIGILLAIALITVGARNFYADPNPAKYEIEGQVIRVYNHSGIFLWNLDMGFIPHGLIRKQQVDSKFKTIQIADYDMDGETEMLIGTSVKNHEFGGALYFVETDGSIKWMYNDHPTLYFGGNEYSSTYAVSYIYPYKHHDSNSYDIYVSFTHRPWFPNQILRFDVDGNVLNRFVHPGSLYDFELFDLNGDGEVEMVIGGTNNRFNTAVMCILPSRNFSGSVPAWEDSSCVLDGGEVDSSLIYVKLPQWGKYDFTNTNARSSVGDIYVDEAHGFGLNTNLGDKDGTGSYIYHFTFDLELDGLAVTDGLLSRYRSKFNRPFFEWYDRDRWTQDMSTIEIWRDGAWTTSGLIETQP